MLYVSLTLSAIFLLVANYQARRRERAAAAVAIVLACGFGLAVLPIFCGLFPSPFATQLLLMAVALWLWQARWRTPRSFLVLSLAATAVAYGIAVWIALPRVLELARLRGRFPYESLEERLPALPRQIAGAQLAGDVEARLKLLEDSVEWERSSHRTIMLQELHEEKVSQFVNSPGFGVARLLFPPSEDGLTYGLRPDNPVPQPTSRRSSLKPAEGGAWEPSALDTEGLDSLHRLGILDFAHPDSFGYVKDRRHVAGFQSHRFSKVPEAKEQWVVLRLELMSLLLHEAPAVYVSENLPRMDEVRDGATRPLDRFEATGLARLRRGEGLALGNGNETFRMLGAIRAATQCVRCHGCERGDLLGAFSYTLRRAGR